MDVKITDRPDEAEYYAANGIPYIVHLHEGNRAESFPSGAFCVEDVEDITPRDLDRVWRRAQGLPWDICKTRRLSVREIMVEDVPRLYELYADSCVTRYMEPLFADIRQEIEYTKEYIRNIYGFYGYGMWVIVQRAAGQVIGRAGLEYKEDFDGLELGFMLGKQYQHKGYAYEACAAVLQYGVETLGVRNYRALVHAENLPSRRLCERLEFRPWNKIPAAPAANDMPREYIEYRISV